MYGASIGLVLPRLLLLAAMVAVGIMAMACGGTSPLENAIRAGFEYTCGVRSDGSVDCWGANGSRQSSPPGAKFQSVSSGFTHTCGIRTSGNVDCWGDDTFGQSRPPGGEFR